MLELANIQLLDTLKDSKKNGVLISEQIRIWAKNVNYTIRFQNEKAQ